MVKVKEPVWGNLTLNLWLETSYSSGIFAAPQTEGGEVGQGAVWV